MDRLKGHSDPLILTVNSMRALTEKTLEEKGLPAEQAIYEPMGRNTAPAVALLCHILQTRGKENEVAGVFPADHLITNQEAFLSAVKLAEQVAMQNEIVTLGIHPKYPATGYGYIEVTEDTVGEQDGLKAVKVEGFREKPDADTATEFLKAGNYFWNAGMFLFKVSHMIDLFKEFQPEMWERVSKIKPDLSDAKYVYANLEAISLDYAIMEKVKSQVCIPCDMGWSDVGSWDELARLGEEYPALKNMGAAQVFNVDSNNNYIFSIRSKVIGLVGISDKIVVDTPDALLVADKGESQKVKELLQQIKDQGLPEATEHPFETRPWGKYEVLCDRNDFKSKVITVHPGHQLSYQSHQKRSEHWVVVSGEAEVVLDDKVHKLSSGEAIFIPQGSKHRMRNPGSTPLIFTETQTGSYFGEDDIVRYKDDYSRV
ncbi:MAG: mannose-1-phosphate guanylyltransferase/mannose-6-phosphate isomerase [Bdellovibrionales bacterium]|nr:mannose-1-phosphate guanylyltransferase/mannose-6-phosphate isomerase [Bdellovibrionales bacterium]